MTVRVKTDQEVITFVDDVFSDFQIVISNRIYSVNGTSFEFETCRWAWNRPMKLPVGCKLTGAVFGVWGWPWPRSLERKIQTLKVRSWCLIWNGQGNNLFVWLLDNLWPTVKAKHPRGKENGGEYPTWTRSESMRKHQDSLPFRKLNCILSVELFSRAEAVRMELRSQRGRFSLWAQWKSRKHKRWTLRLLTTKNGTKLIR